VVQAQEEVWVEGVGAGWVVTALELDPAAAVFVLIAAPSYPIKQELPAII
jgi:hypothetical protein